MNKKWIASVASICLLASSFTTVMAEGMKPGTYTLSTAMKPRQLMAVLSGEDVEFDWGQEEES